MKPHILTGSIAEFATGPSVAQARYRKDIKEKDSNRAESNYTRSALAGAAIGALARKPGMTRGRAAAIGAGAGLAAQGALRIATSGTKDSFGDRSHAAKVVEKLPWQAGALTAGALALRKARAKITGITAPLRKVRQVFASARHGGVTHFSTASLRKSVLHGTALAGGITAADALTSAAIPENGKSRKKAALHGAARGAIYGTGLAIAEPAILAALRRIPVRKLSARGRVVQFGGRQQILDDQNRYADPLKVASGNAQGYTRDNRGVLNPVDIPVQHAQVVRAAYNKAGTIYKHGTRAGGLLKDVHAVATGKPKEAGRKREWDKAWFRRAVGSAVVAGGVLAHTHTMRKNPVYRAKVNSVVAGAKSRANRLVPDLFPTFSARRRVIRFATPEERRGHPYAKAVLTAGALGGIGILTHKGVKAIGSLQKRGEAFIGRLHATVGKPNKGSTLNDVLRSSKSAASAATGAATNVQRLTGAPSRAWASVKSAPGRAWGWAKAKLGFSSQRPLIRFDWNAAMSGWDVRDPRGRSARVFAPGARSRERREKKWHERVDNIRKLAIAGAVTAAAAGGVGGYLLGKRGMPRIVKPPKRVRNPGTAAVPANVTPMPQSAALSATPRRVIAFGTRTLKTGKLAGMTVRWGRDLPAKLPMGSFKRTKGTMQIVEPGTGLTKTIQRGRDAMAENAQGWHKGRNAYISNIHLPKAARNTIEGGRAIQRMTGGVFDHFDGKRTVKGVEQVMKGRQVRTSVIAGAYEKRNPAARLDATHRLVAGYQKRGYGISGRHIDNNEYNVVMTRQPGAVRKQPISRKAFEGHMVRARERSTNNAALGLRQALAPSAPGAAIAAAGAVTSRATGGEDSDHRNVSRAAGVAAAAGLAHAGLKIHGNTGEIGSRLGTLANNARINTGKWASARGAKRIGKGLLTGIA